MPSIYLIFSFVCIYYNDYKEVLNHPKPFSPEGFERSEQTQPVSHFSVDFQSFWIIR